MFCPGSLCHSTHLGPNSSSLASFFASIFLLETEENDEFLLLLLRQIAATLPWLAAAVTRRILDQRYSPALLKENLKPIPSQVILPTQLISEMSKNKS